MLNQINRLVEQSSSRIQSGIANFLPGVLALIVILLVTFLLAWIVRMALGRFLREPRQRRFSASRPSRCRPDA